MSNKRKTISVVFITDDYYIVPTSVAIQSLVDHITDNFDYEINIVCNQMQEVNKAKLKSFASVKSNLKIRTIDYVLDSEDLQLNNDDKYMVANATALIKFDLANIFVDLERILYLDGDLLIKCDVAEIFNTNLGDNYVAAVRDLPQVLYKEQLIGKEISGQDYFNSGVMLLNLKLMRENKIKDKLIETKKQLASDNLMDQNVFNVVFKNKVTQLDYLYNVCPANYARSEIFNYKNLKKFYNHPCPNIHELLIKAKIVHFSSFMKPWIYYDALLADEWTQYFLRSPLKNVPLNRVSYHAQKNILYKKTKNLIMEDNLNDSKYEDKIIPIVFCANHNYCLYTCVAIQSIKENIKDFDHLYKIYIFHDEELSLADKYILEQMSCQNLVVKCLDVRNLIKKEELYTRAHYSKQMFYRWLIPEVLPHYKKVIYLDCDLVVNKDIKELYDTQMDDCTLAAVINPVKPESSMCKYVENLNISPMRYVNSGVLLIDTQRFLQNKIKDKCLKLIINNLHYVCPDQDALNVILQNDICFLPETWNFQWLNSTKTISDKYEFNYNIIHFTTGAKPWKLQGCNMPLAEYFWKYARNTNVYEKIIFAEIKRASCAKRKIAKWRKLFIVRLITWPFRMTKRFFVNLRKNGLKITLKKVKLKIRTLFKKK